MFLHFLRLVLAIGPMAVASAAPVINEIMYRPGTGLPERTGDEFIEIHNPDAQPVDVSGWRFSTGIDFTIPAGRVIPANGYLVVCANITDFQARYPGVTNVIGNWVGTLANSGEKVTLVDAAGVVVDQVSYADEGDWATRVREPSFGGWDWATLADGGGRSLELRQPQLSNNNGQNWTPGAAANGTPGAANSNASANIAPLIKDVRHTPAVPRSTENVVISCELEDEAATGFSATLFWRVSSAAPPAFTSTPMIDQGSGEFSATLGPRVDKSIIEFYVEATDGTSSRTWPAATDGASAADRGQFANGVYQVDDAVPVAQQPLYRLVLTVPENTAYQQLAGSNPGSDRQFHMTFIGSIGGDPDVRYRSSMRIRGASSRGHDPKPLRISIPGDEPWNGSSGFNLNPKYSWLQYIGAKLFQASGLPANDSKSVEVRRNGVNYARGDGFDYGRWAHMEDLNSDYAGKHFPLDPNGNLYNKVRPDNNWAWRNGNLGAYAGDGWSKQSNAAANDWADLDTFLGAMNASSGTANYLPDIEAVADLDQWMDWFAIETILANRETNASNGADDDYSMYRGEFDPRFKFLPHDFDTILGGGDTPSPSNHTIFDMTSSGDVLEPLVPFFQIPSIRQRYFQSLRKLCQSTFAPARFDPFIDSHLGGWVPAGTLSTIKVWMEERCAFIESSIAPELGPPVPLPVPTTVSSFTSPHGALFINEVLAKNVAAQNIGGTFPDWIELRNTGAAALDLTGKSITDTADVKNKFVFTAGTVIPAGGYLVLYADGGTGPGIHLGFELESEGDQVFLYDTAASGQALIDSVGFGPQAADFSIGRTGAGLDVWTLCPPSPGAANSVQPTGNAAGVVINEWLANPRVRVTSDFLELFNPATLPVRLGGLAITDDFANYPDRHKLPPLSFITPMGFAVLKPKGNLASPGNPSELPFKLSAVNGWAAILGDNGVLIDHADTDCQFPDVSRGRQPDGAGALANFIVPTPGRPNLLPGAATLALLNGLRITEIHYNPPGGGNFEFVELKNIGATSLSLAGVRFTDGIDFTFPSGATLAPNAFFVLIHDPVAFASRYPAVSAGGVFGGALDNSGEPVALTLPLPDEVNILAFEFEDGWHPSTDGGGYALELIDPAGTLPQDFDKKSKWGASGQLHGTPGSSGPPIITSPLSTSGTLGDPFAYQISGTNGPTGFNATGLPGGLNVDPGTGLISGNPTAFGAFSPTIHATNVGGSGSATLSLFIAASGPLHHFTWANVLSPKNEGVPFPVQVTAKDAQERTVIGFNGQPNISAFAGTGTSSSLIITECKDQDPDEFEIQNVSGQAIDTTGWFIIINNAGPGTNDVNTIVQDRPPLTQPELPASFTPGQLLRVTDNSADSLFYWANIPWSHVNRRRGWAMIVNNTGAIVDFTIWGFTDPEVAALDITVNGFNLNPVLQGAWTGPAIVHDQTTGVSLQRSGNEDHNNAADFSWPANSINVQNPSLQIPFGGSTAVPLTPASALFSSGRWIGLLTVNQTQGSVRLRADDGAGHAGLSNVFDVAAPLTDSDGDGIPDAWETGNGLNPGTNDANADKDSDGQSNLAEYLAGTSPGDARSVLKVLSAAAVPSGQVTLTWASVPGKAYRVMHSTSLLSWTEIPGTRRLATGSIGSVTFTDPAPGGPRAFFHLELMTN